MANGLVVVFGAAGHVGGVIADRLLKAGRRVRVGGRSVGRLEALARRGAEAVAADVTDGAAVRRALEGAEAAFVLSPPPGVTTGIRALQDRVAQLIGDGLEAARVPFAVALSSIGAELSQGNGPIAGLHVLEERLRRIAGLRTLSLRAGYFFENTLGSIAMIKATGAMGGPIRPDLPVACIASRDIGEAAASRLQALDWQGFEALELQGERHLTQTEVASALGRAIGKPDLTYRAFPYPDAEKGMIQAGLPPELAALYVEMARGFNEGRLRPLQPRSASTTTATSIESWAAEVFAPAYRHEG